MIKGSKVSEESKEKNRLAHLGKKVSEETKKKMSKAHKKIKKPWLVMKGEKSPHWKGGISPETKFGYRVIHRRIEKLLGKANHCENCGLDKIPKGKKRYFQWANIDHKYNEEIKDWKQLCIKCHKKLDKKLKNNI